MYFLNIEALKNDLAKEPLSEKQTLQYLLVDVFSNWLSHINPNKTLNHWTIISHILTIAIVLLGILYCFKKNGGINGEHFLQRYFSIGWVIGLRMILFLIIPSAILTVVIEHQMGIIHTSYSWYSILIISIISVIIYWRTGYHIGQVANNSTAGVPYVPIGGSANVPS